MILPRLFKSSVLLLMGLLSLTLGAQSPQETFLKGNIAYGNGNYPEAVEAYREVLKDVRSPEVHYNLGNALAQQNKWSEAAFHYMKAYSLNPNFEAARANLLLAADRMGLAADYPHLASPARLLSERQWTTLAAITFWLALIFFFHGDFIRFRIPLSKTLGTLTALVFLTSLIAIMQHKLFKEWAVVSSSLVSLRVAPTEQSPGESVLVQGDPIRIIGEQKGFYHVMTTSGAEGFILHSEVYSLSND
ncbi:MAG TPA: tetratricopeptide repeat protein [Oceanipulchritudo sp.]|nr:tetratricopeptide repeat protein [Oceanipulchritudo sp.]